MRPASTLDAYRPVIEPVEQFLFGQAGRQAGNPAKAAAVMIAAVDSTTPPLRLMLGEDAHELWDRTLAARNQDLAAWRARGQATAFGDAPMRPIGGG